MLAQASSLVPLVYLLSTSVDACAIGWGKVVYAISRLLDVGVN